MATASGTVLAAAAERPSNSVESAWLENLTSQLGNLEDFPQQPFFQVPHSLRTNVNADAYQPILFNFGLWHGQGGAPIFLVHDSSSPALAFKLQAAKIFCRLGDEVPSDRFHHLVKRLRESDKKLRNCYGLRIDEEKLSSTAVASALALDTITVYVAAMESNDELRFHPSSVRSGKSNHKLQFHPPCVRFIVRNDAVLLDNQLPIFAFRCLLEVLNTTEGMDAELRRLINLYGCRNSPFPVKGLCVKVPDSASGGDNDLKSLLGCIYDAWSMKNKMHCISHEEDTQAPSRISHAASKNNDSYQLVNVPLQKDTASSVSTLLSAAHLYRRGIRFEADQNSDTDTWSLDTCIMFEGYTVTLPKLTVRHGTRRFLLNLLAYEHTSRFTDACTLLSFVCFMDMLINSEHDVELLVDWGVLVNELGSHKQLAVMWNGLTDGYPFRLSENHQELVLRIRMASQKRWRRWMHAFRDSHYERRPWLLVSAVFAMVLFILTLLQTIYTMRHP